MYQAGVDVIYHASYIDEEGMQRFILLQSKACAYQDTGMNMLEKEKNRYIVVPALNWLWATTYEAEAFGYTHDQAEKAGYKRELDTAVAGLREMHRRGIIVLPGGSVHTSQKRTCLPCLTSIGITDSLGHHMVPMRETSNILSNCWIFLRTKVSLLPRPASQRS